MQDFKDFHYLETNNYYYDIRAKLKRYFKLLSYQKVLESGLYKKVNYLSMMDYVNSINGIVRDNNLDDYYINLCNEYSYGLVKSAKQFNQSRYARVERLKDRITKYLIMGQCIFVTLTFNDETMKKTNQATRRKYVARFLRSISQDYVANIDFGVDDRFTHREHYHALIVKDFIFDKWEYGFTWFEQVRLNQSNSNELLAKYISKLTNHAIKTSARYNYYIYSRKNNIIYSNSYYIKFNRFITPIYNE